MKCATTRKVTQSQRSPSDGVVPRNLVEILVPIELTVAAVLLSVTNMQSHTVCVDELLSCGRWRRLKHS